MQVGACFPSGASAAAILDDSTSEVFISPHLRSLLTTQKNSWGKLTGLLKTVHQVGIKIIYENYFFLPEWIDFYSLPVSIMGCVKGWQLTLMQAPFVF